MTQTATKAQKQVKVINRYEFKTRNMVVYEVRSSNGVDIYRTTFLDGHATGCSCPARVHHCYHMIQLQPREDERHAAQANDDGLRFNPWHGSNYGAERQERFCDRCHKQTDEYRVQDGEVLCERCIRELERNAQPRGTLNGSSQGFSLLK